MTLELESKEGNVLLISQLTAGKTCAVYQLTRRRVTVCGQHVDGCCSLELESKKGNVLLIYQLTAGKTCPVYQLTRRHVTVWRQDVEVDTATCDRLETGRRRLLESKEGNVLLISQLTAGKTCPVYQLTRRHVTVWRQDVEGVCRCQMCGKDRFVA
ncbi:hypothetical protein J6590_052197 [Homalodisca vitripennis]|nr:hypothetical protein J6590_052197 [Homalodisca vitripennis]